MSTCSTLGASSSKLTIPCATSKRPETTSIRCFRSPIMPSCYRCHIITSLPPVPCPYVPAPGPLSWIGEGGEKREREKEYWGRHSPNRHYTCRYWILDFVF